jgi:hypothetical protein
MADQSADQRETLIPGLAAPAAAVIAPTLGVPNLNIVPFGAMLDQVPEALRHRYGSLLEELKSVMPQFFVQDMVEAIGDLSEKNTVLPDRIKIKLTQVLMAVQAYYNEIVEKNKNPQKTELSRVIFMTAVGEACDILYAHTKSSFAIHRYETPLEKNAREIRDKLLSLILKYKITSKPEWVILSEPHIMPTAPVLEERGERSPPPAPVFTPKLNKPFREQASVSSVSRVGSENRAGIGGLEGHIQQFLSQRASSSNEDRGAAITRAQEQRREALRQQELESNPLARRLGEFRRAMESDNSSDSDSGFDDLKDSFIDDQRVSLTPQFSASIKVETPDSPVEQLSDELKTLSLKEDDKTVKKPN